MDPVDRLFNEFVSKAMFLTTLNNFSYITFLINANNISKTQSPEC